VPYNKVGQGRTTSSDVNASTVISCYIKTRFRLYRSCFAFSCWIRVSSFDGEAVQYSSYAVIVGYHDVVGISGVAGDACDGTVTIRIDHIRSAVDIPAEDG